jgi:hypothetical protein
VGYVGKRSVSAHDETSAGRPAAVLRNGFGERRTVSDSAQLQIRQIDKAE